MINSFGPGAFSSDWPGPRGWPYPRKSIASTRNPACSSACAYVFQLSLLKRPPCASTTARSPFPCRSARTFLIQVPPKRRT
jgi:hypothetical protein